MHFSLFHFFAEVIQLSLEVLVLDAQILYDVVLKGHKDRESK